MNHPFDALKEAALKRLAILALLFWLITTAVLNALQTPRNPSEDDAITPITDVARSSGRQEEPNASPATFVGRDACKECHAENHSLHTLHGHHKTFATTNDPKIIQMFDGRSYDSGEPYGIFTYHSDEEGLFARLPEKFGDRPFRLQYALGSAHGAVTLLTLLPDENQETFAIEHRVSWFRDGDELRPTPQEHNGNPTTAADFFGLRHQGRVMEKCVYCHTTRGTIAQETIRDLISGVNCEKCHGPGSEHVRLARSSKTPPKYSVGREDWDAESEIQLCGDCHRLPVTVSRSELRDYPDQLTRFQPVGLLRSRCFVESGGNLRCTTCHNPHQTISDVPKSSHVANCIACHQPNNPAHTLCSVNQTDGCIECHMPAKELAGLSVSFHDHWIRVHPKN